MTDQPEIVRVWIDDGCIICDACENAAPDVFQVADDSCTIRPEALDPEFLKTRTPQIADAALECPVEVIKYETAATQPAQSTAPAVSPSQPA